MSSIDDNVVDLTMDTSSEDGLTADEVVVAATTVVGNPDSIRAQQPSPLERRSQRRNSAPPSKSSRAPTPSHRPTPNVSPAARSTARAADGTPSRPPRFSTRDEIRDSQSPPPSTKPPAQPQLHQHPTPESSGRSSRGRQTPSTQTPKRMEWTVEKVADALAALAEDVGQGHARLVNFALEEADKKVPRPRHHSTVDVFASMQSIAIDSSSTPPPDLETMAVKFKQHSGEYGKSKGNGRRFLYPVVPIKPDREAVPGYRFHHVEIRKNVLAPNSMLNFVPHLRDVDPNSAEEKKYSNWLIDLENLDSKSGFQTQNRTQRLAKRAQNEYAATLSTYLEPWLRKLAIDGCTKSTLIRYMATQPENDNTITPQQKSSLLGTHSADIGSPHARRGAKIFTEAFDRVFNNDKIVLRRVSLRDVLMLDKSVEPILDNKRAKEVPSAQKPRDEALMQKTIESLGSYSTLGCLICFSHDCEHGEIERDNQKRCFSLEEIGGLAPTLREKWAAQVEAQKNSQSDGMANRPTHQPCRNQCYRSYDTGNPNQAVEPWTENEVSVLEWVFATVGYSSSLKAQCFVGAVLGRPCWDVHRKFKELDLTLPPIEPRAEPPRPKPLSWYDRKKKQLLGDWQDATITHEHAVRELYAPCHHDGPCTAANGCPCASAGSHPVLCERFCLCTAEECALKFTGCACHSSGKTCLQRQKEGRPCICVQLNRECDPVLCRGCGAKERADPENAYDEQLHSTGCQNVALQRGAAKTVLLGKSQLECCGYGLFAAEDIAQDEFVIEYTGELISHDEGVRREHRRGDVFDEENKVSYLFTLLEQEGIWVDAAMYGNLSRYINHASEACNIMPKIMYVNHEFRIKFSALRDIKAGEELFFNYGDNFPNLTKKLVERNERSADANKNATGQKRKGGAQRGTARKTTSKANGEGIDFAPDGREDDEDPWLRDDWLQDLAPVDDDDVGDDWEDHNPKRRKKRGGKRPGAGRKKKQPQPPATTTETGDDISPGSQLRTELNSSQQQGQNGNPLNPTTPTRRRTLKRSYASMLNPLQSFSGSEAQAGSTPATSDGAALVVKKVSKRGGARPGAGRKPKHPRPPGAPPKGSGKSTTTTATTTTANSASKTGEPDTPRNNQSLNYRSPKPNSAIVTISLPPGALGAAGRKRKAAELETESPSSITAAATSSTTATTSSTTTTSATITTTSTTATTPAASVGPYRQDTFQPIFDDAASSTSGRGLRGGSSSGMGGHSRGGSSAGTGTGSGTRGASYDDGDDDEEESMVDRSARKRQKPLRYRDEEE
ncbi:hypothetical protein MFIFM68171_01069 [Madurella fahalii]|uniref:Uncharacterized protein n=1 Tax=Madurella fahalii TaxID=1157608 RepID=A0ABQ0FZJ9_9PEZI